MIDRASTPTELFGFASDPTEFDEILITYSQGDEIILEKHKSDLTFNGNVASFMFTQAETKLFAADKLVATQIRVAWNNGESFPSQIVYRRVRDVLDDKTLPEV